MIGARHMQYRRSLSRKRRPKRRKTGLDYNSITRDIVENRYSFKYYVRTSDMSSQLPFTVVQVYIYYTYRW